MSSWRGTLVRPIGDRSVLPWVWSPHRSPIQAVSKDTLTPQSDADRFLRVVAMIHLPRVRWLTPTLLTDLTAAEEYHRPPKTGA